MAEPQQRYRTDHPHPLVAEALQMLSHLLMLLESDFVIADIDAVDAGADPGSVECKTLREFEVAHGASIESEFAIDELERQGWGLYERADNGGLTCVTARV